MEQVKQEVIPSKAITPIAIIIGNQNVFVLKDEDKYAIGYSKEEVVKHLEEVKNGNPLAKVECPNFLTRMGKVNPSKRSNASFIVGASSFIQDNTTYYIRNTYDIYLFWYQTGMGFPFRAGLIANPTHGEYKPIYIHASSNDPVGVIKKCLLQLSLEIYKLNDVITIKQTETIEATNFDKKLNIWLNLWISRQSKISLKDVLHLEGK